MKKIYTMLIAVLMVLCLAGCGGQAEEDGDDTIRIVATIFPAYEWTQEVLGDNPAGMEVTLLQDSGVDLHSFQPTAQDMVSIASCDLFIYTGGESEDWVEDALQEAVNPDMHVIHLLDLLGSQAKEEETVEGMQEETGDTGEAELDEHVWLSLHNAQLFTDAIAQDLAALDPAHEAVYMENAARYKQQLKTLDQAYEQVVSGADVDTLLFGDRFPFRYLADDYGLSYYAAFPGCSAETEASFETIQFLAGKLDELGLACVLTIEGSDEKIARTIIQNTKKKQQEILTMDSMQSVTAEEIKSDGVTYLSIMEDNLQVLQEALRGED